MDKGGAKAERVYPGPTRGFHLAVIEYLYRGRRAVPLQIFTIRQ